MCPIFSKLEKIDFVQMSCSVYYVFTKRTDTTATTTTTTTTNNNNIIIIINSEQLNLLTYPNH
jgi:hypothetical protein